MELMKIEDGKVIMTSREIAELTGKRHDNVIKDIEDESKKLGNEIGHLIFEETFYRDKSNRQSKQYTLTKDGVMQIGARYDAKIRYQLIQKLNELEKRGAIPQTFEEAMLLAISQHKEIKRLTEVEKNHKLLIHQKKRLYKITELATETGFRSAIALNEFLRKRGIQRKVNKTWVLNAKYNQLGLVEKKIVENIYHKDGKPVYDMRFTETGRLFVIKQIELAYEGK